MEKTIFEIFDELNVADCINNTKNLQVANSLVSAKKVKGGGHVTMGVPLDLLYDIVLNQDKKIILLLVVDRKEYEKLKSK